jgi:hypothetical protein
MSPNSLQEYNLFREMIENIKTHYTSESRSQNVNQNHGPARIEHEQTQRDNHTVCQCQNSQMTVLHPGGA